ncbi:MAG: DEAD/DEAH box helicase family protein [Acidobacteriota bacterium]|nr:DEAD/DEAH box helicase family protein [Acidobacteriota bacterium]
MLQSRAMEPTLQFDAGTILLEGADQSFDAPPPCEWDERVNRWRAPAIAYRQIVTELTRRKIPHEDQARKYIEFQFKAELTAEPRPYQEESIAAWKNAGRRGIVILPTGAGKTFVAQMAIEMVGRSTLVVVPTIDLMNQWYDLLLSSFNAEIGLIGGGYFEKGAIIVTTYASAFRFMERMGDQFGFIIFDECHHLPSDVYRYAAEMAIAPFRLGLTATPERPGEEAGANEVLERLIGPIVYRKEAQHLAGEFLADYTTEQITVTLSPAEREAYDRERNLFRQFIREKGINFSDPRGWQNFIMMSARSADGRRAMQAYRESKRIALGTDAKLHVLEKLMQRHRRERLIVFTAENEMVYRISEQFLIPAITHETPIKERRLWLDAFNKGDVLALATSKVLNEGVNIPEAAVAVVLSGSGSSREHIQRLGRILRKQPDKQAVLYEVITAQTAEERISQRRTSARQFQRDQALGDDWLE